MLISVRIIRWMEWLFILPAIFMLMFLPIPPHAAEIGSFAVLSIGILGASFVWWGLRIPTQRAWWGALALSLAWLLNSIELFRAFWSLLILGVTGHSIPDQTPSAVVISYCIAGVPTIAQAIILLVWLWGRNKVVIPAGAPRSD